MRKLFDSWQGGDADAQQEKISALVDEQDVGLKPERHHALQLADDVDVTELFPIDQII